MTTMARKPLRVVITPSVEITKFRYRLCSGTTLRLQIPVKDRRSTNDRIDPALETTKASIREIEIAARLAMKNPTDIVPKRKMIAPRERSMIATPKLRQAKSTSPERMEVHSNGTDLRWEAASRPRT